MTVSLSGADDLGEAQSQLVRRLPEHVGRLQWSAADLAAHQRAQLQALLAHAIERSPFHARRLDGIDCSGFEISDLSRLPSMTKAEMIASFDEVVTDDRLTRRLVEDHLAASTERSSLLLDRYLCLASGGSSGLRGVFVQTLDEYVEFFASLRRRSVARASSAGGLPAEGLVIALVAAAAPVHSSALAAAIFGSGGSVRFISVPATLPLREIVARLNSLQPQLLTGYPSMLARLAVEQQAGRLRITPQSITATSEQVTDEDRAAIARAFGAAMVDQFASTEGLVGHTEPGGFVHTFASDMCIVEPVDEENRPVAEGTPSAKVLLTNLHNFTQPLIRYELTDRFVAQPSGEDGCFRATVTGRADEVFRYGATEIHPLIIRSVMVKTPEVSEYEVRQTERGIEIGVVAEEGLDITALKQGLEHGLRQAGLSEPEVVVRVVTEVQRYGQTGKARRFISLAGAARG